MTGSISGLIVDADNGQKIANCMVSMSPGGKSMVTASDGLYEFKDIEPGDYTLTFTKAGYNNESAHVNIVAGQASRSDVQMKAKAAFSISDDILDFGDLDTSKTFNLYNNSDQECSFSIGNIPTWLKLSRTSGKVFSGSSEMISAEIDRENAEYGEHSQTLTISYEGRTSGSTRLIVKFTKVKLSAPTVSCASQAENVTQTSFDIRGNIDATGGQTITSYGHCWSVSQNPTVNDSKTNFGTTTSMGAFNSAVTGLSKNTTYYVRAYATNSQGTSYSESVIVQTSASSSSEKWDGNKAKEFAGGSGIKADPYIIKTGGQLLLMKDHPSDYYVLANDIDLDNRNWLPFEFKGDLDGKNYSVMNLNIERSEDYQGLFSKVSGKVSNLEINGVKINAANNNYIGALAGEFKGGSITNCHVVLKSDSKLLGMDYVGGIIGYINGANISDCVVESENTRNYNIFGNNYVGGIAGQAYSFTAEGKSRNCLAFVGISGTKYVGGIFGNGSGCEITYCSYVGSISGCQTVGGIAGMGRGSVIACKSEISLEASEKEVGGIIGYNDYTCTIGACYSIGTIDCPGDCWGIGAYSCYLCYSLICSSSSKYQAIGKSSIQDCASPFNIGDKGTNCKSNCTNITQFLQEAYSDYAEYWNFNNTWTWTGTVDGQAVSVSCPRLAWE